MIKSKDRLRKDKPKAFITGVSGFVASHLVDLLASQDYRISGIDSAVGLVPLSEACSAVLVSAVDILDSFVLRKVLKDAEPDYVYHLAGSAFVPDAESDPNRVYEVNIFGTLNLLEAVRIVRPGARVLIVGSGEVYGAVPDANQPIREDFPLRPVTPYGVTKASADLLAYQYAAAHRLEVIRVRPFNHTGPRQSERFAHSGFAKQIAEIEKGLREPVLNVGNLDARRDFTDVRDVVRAYQMILERAQGGDVYNVGSGKAWRIGDLLKILIDRSTIREIKIQEQKARLRQNDIPVMLCDPAKLEKGLGWKPTISIEQTMQDLLEYWREKMKIYSEPAP